ncbi:hypothetical protein DFJ73DRAFT_824733 [Zopfochytrium polystomum]|nr:hypothetical protein DFJ73DRAFT_824733 [Zopfochytrium polystomum]
MGTSVAATDNDAALRVKREDVGWWGAGVSASFSPRGAFEKVVLARMERSTKDREMGAPRVLTHNEASRALQETKKASDVVTFGDLTHDGVDHEQNNLTRSPRLGESAFSIFDYNSTFSRIGPSNNVTVAPQPEAVSPGNTLAKGGIVEQVLEEDEDHMWDRIFSGDVQDLENRDFPSAQREEIWAAHNAVGRVEISPQHDLIGDSLDGRQVDSADRQSWRPVDRQPLSQRPPSPDAQLLKSCGVTAAVQEAVEDESAALASRVAALESDVEAIHAAMTACLDRVRIVEQTVF